MSEHTRPQNRNFEKRDLEAAHEELTVLGKLSAGVGNKIAELSRRPPILGRIDNTELAFYELRYDQRKAYEELARRSYGRTVKGAEVDENDRFLAKFTFRITQANVGYPDDGCLVVARNSALASELITAQPGDQRDVTTVNRDRFFNISEVRTFDGPTSLLSRNQAPNFGAMSLRRGAGIPVVLENLRNTIALPAPKPIRPEDKPPQILSREPSNPTWLDDWYGVHLEDSEEQSLGHQFFTRTTTDQERALNNPRGLTFVEGIAGAGKTSVALGRLKYFSNFSTGQELERHGLQTAPIKDFLPESMIGFVLSSSLKRYLKDTAASLHLDRLPIRDFEEFRTDLSTRFGLTNRFRRRKDIAPAIRTRMSWARGLDSALARCAAIRLHEVLDQNANLPESVIRSVSLVARELSEAEPMPNSKIWHLISVIQRIVSAVADSELREREKVTREKFPVRELADNERRRREQRSLEIELELIAKEAERKELSPLARLLSSKLICHDLFAQAVGLNEFPELMMKAFDTLPESAVGQEIKRNIEELRSAFNEPAERRALSDADIVTLLVLSSLAIEGFDYQDNRVDFSYRSHIRHKAAVFIDEVQDFTEIEVALMGLMVSDEYNQITISGDRCQRLQDHGAQTYDDLFPLISRARQNPPIFLKQNFRQRPELALLSAGFRSLIQKDVSVEVEADRQRCAVIHTFLAREQMTSFVLEKIRTVPTHATVAVILPTLEEAKVWLDLLEEDLSSLHRAPLLSQREDLTRRFRVHFTEARETKGLEFNVVIVPDLTAFALSSTVGRNQAYVALTRAKQCLLLGCNGNVQSPEIDLLVKKNFISSRNL